eukprot:2725699-Amphidinium_carterae.1
MKISNGSAFLPLEINCRYRFSVFCSSWQILSQNVHARGSKLLAGCGKPGAWEGQDRLDGRSKIGCACTCLHCVLSWCPNLPMLFIATSLK